MVFMLLPVLWLALCAGLIAVCLVAFIGVTVWAAVTSRRR